jgi:hypothetical protein
MKKDVQLSIPTPCHEKWSSFTTTAQGGFCGNCRKEVIDFSNWTEEQILAYFNTKPSHACGRFRPDQLKVYMQPTLLKISPGFLLLKAGLLSVLLLILGRPATAQREPVKQKTEVVTQSKLLMGKPIAVQNERILKGTVTSKEDGLPLPGVNVIIKGTVNGTATNADGKFELSVSDGDVLLFSFIGLTTVEYVVGSNESAEIKMELNIELACDFVVLGEIAVNDVYKSPSAFQQLWSALKSIF